MPQPLVSRATTAMIEYEQGNPRRIHHFLKVYAFAKAIAELEGMEPQQRELLELAALTHDIGIKPSEQKYGSGAGNYQQIEGPAPARALLAPLGVAPEVIERICYLIAHHHTYRNIDGLDYQILVEADFLVNLYEHGSGSDEVKAAREKVFRTATGLCYLDALFPPQD